MELQHSFTVPAPVDQAWATLLDIQGVAPCFPGATLTEVNGEEFAGTVKVKLGPVSLQYAGKGRFIDRDDAAHTATIEAQGSDKRGNGTAGAQVRARMEAESDTTTRVVVDTDLKITGRPAQFGRGVIQDVGGRIIQQFADNLAGQMASGGASSAATADGGEAPAATDSTPAATDSTPAATDDTPAAAPDATPSTTDSTPSSGTGVPVVSKTEPDRPAAPRPTPVHHAAPASSEPAAELDLGAHVWPVIIRSYGPKIAAGVGGLTVLFVVLRRLRRR